MIDDDHSVKETTNKRTGFFQLKTVASSRVVEALGEALGDENSDDDEDDKGRQKTVNLIIASTSLPVNDKRMEGTISSTHENTSTGLSETAMLDSLPPSSPLSSNVHPVTVSASRPNDEMTVLHVQQGVDLCQPVKEGESVMENDEDEHSSSTDLLHPTPIPPLIKDIVMNRMATTGNADTTSFAPDPSTITNDIPSQDHSVDVTSGLHTTHNTPTDSTTNNINNTSITNSTTTFSNTSQSEMKTPFESTTTASQKAPATASPTESTATPLGVSELPQPPPQSSPTPSQSQPKTSKNKSITSISSHVSGGSGGSSSGGGAKSSGGGEGGSSSTPPPLPVSSSMMYPIDTHREDILRFIQRDRVTIIAGKTPLSLIPPPSLYIFLYMYMYLSPHVCL